MDVVPADGEKMSGKIDILSKEGEGNSIIMRIPLM